MRLLSCDGATVSLQPAGYQLEPNLAFLPGTGDGRHIRIQVRFSYESLPGWLARDTLGWQTAEYLLPLHGSRSSLAEAAQAWNQECSKFPHRL